MQLIRITYMSRPTDLARRPSFGAAVGRLKEQSQRDNLRHGLTGALLVSPTWFIQVLEGGEAAATDLLDRISRDPRHRDVRVFEQRLVEERLFGRFAMHVDGFDRVDPDLVWRCIDCFERPEVERPPLLIRALLQSTRPVLPARRAAGA